MTEDDRELWGTIRGWSERLGIAEEVLKERFRDLPSQPCRSRSPDDPNQEIISDAYPQTQVLEAARAELSGVGLFGERLGA